MTALAPIKVPHRRSTTGGNGRQSKQKRSMFGCVHSVFQIQIAAPCRPYLQNHDHQPV
jgi:hypothetical protein